MIMARVLGGQEGFNTQWRFTVGLASDFTEATGGNRKIPWVDNSTIPVGYDQYNVWNNTTNTGISIPDPYGSAAQPARANVFVLRWSCVLYSTSGATDVYLIARNVSVGDSYTLQQMITVPAGVEVTVSGVKEVAEGTDQTVDGFEFQIGASTGAVGIRRNANSFISGYWRRIPRIIAKRTSSFVPGYFGNADPALKWKTIPLVDNADGCYDLDNNWNNSTYAFERTPVERPNAILVKVDYTNPTGFAGNNYRFRTQGGQYTQQYVSNPVYSAGSMWLIYTAGSTLPTDAIYFQASQSDSLQRGTITATAYVFY